MRVIDELLLFLLGLVCGFGVGMSANYERPSEPIEKEVIVLEFGHAPKVEIDVIEAIDLMARCVESEAGNQDLMGKRLVVDVILNRVDSSRFPDDICSVIKQPYQFTTYFNGSMDRIDPSEETYKAISLELECRTDSDILFFTAGGYNQYCIPAYQYGDHYFGY